MSSTRQKLKLDERSFEGLLAAAYTIQQHNDKRKAAAAAQKPCDHCGVPMPAGEQVCVHCGSDPEGLRPGEKMQRNWASLWLMSQNQEWRPVEPVSSTGSTIGTAAATTAGASTAAEDQAAFDPADLAAGFSTTGFSPAASDPVQAESHGLRISEVAADPNHFNELLARRDLEDSEELDGPHAESALVQVDPTRAVVADDEPWTSSYLSNGHPAEQDSVDEDSAGEVLTDESLTDESLTDELAPSVGQSFRWQDLAFWKRPVKLRFSRADLYLVLSIAVAAVALLWVAAGSAVPKHAPPVSHRIHLTLWERTLVGLGLAEAPEPPVYRGDPSVKVWVDPHTALYYCSGEEEYGKTTDGHFTTQRDAQMDQFEPSERAACE